MDNTRFNTTAFMRIQVPLMILANLLLFMFAIFFMPDWIFGTPKVFPPYPQESIFNTVAEGIQTVTDTGTGAVGTLFKGATETGVAKNILKAVVPK